MEQNLKKIKRTIQKQKMKDFCIVLLFFLILPYTCGILFANERIVVAQKEEKKESYIKIIMENEYGEQTLAFDEYLLGVLAAVIPGGYEKETIKAQCVIIRSACYRLLYQSAESRFEKNAILRQEHLNLPYLT